MHGFGEHGLRYARFARQLNAHGFVVAANDHRGMGGSSGARGHVRDYEEYLDDLALAESRLRHGRSAETSLFIYGHSMGGLIALMHATRPSARAVSGTILSGPLLASARRLPAWQLRMVPILARLAPGLRLPLPFNETLLTHDVTEQAALAADPLGFTHTTAAWIHASARAVEAVRADIGCIAWPTLWLIAGDDRICCADASRDLFALLDSSMSHTVREYPGLFHELHQESPADRDRVCADVVAWLQAAAGSAPSGC